MRLATLATAAMAGLFYAFAVTVMVGLARADDRTFVVAMNRINDGVRNAGFAFGFFGAFGFTAGSAVLHRRAGLTDAFRWIVAALALYVTALAVTFGVNIPLNDRLASVDPDDLGAAAAARRDFEGPWNASNAVRVAASSLAVLCLAEAHERRGRQLATGYPHTSR